MTRFRSMRRFVSEQIFATVVRQKCVRIALRGRTFVAVMQACPSSKMRLTTKVRVSNGSGGSVSGDPQIAICGMQQGVTSLLRPSRGSLYAS